MDGFNVTSTPAKSTDAPLGAPTDLFPLPLSPFERYMLLDDSATYPMSFVLIIRLKGNLQRDAFEQSVVFALNRHPLLMSQTVHIRGKGQCWMPVATPSAGIRWQDHDQPTEGQVHKRIDLVREIGVRISVEHFPDNANVLFEFHHACTDGIGGIQFIGDLLAGYAQLTTPPDGELPELEPVEFDRLRARALFSTAENEPVPKSVSSPYRLGQRLLKLLRRGPVPLVATRSRMPSGTPLEFPAMISRTIEKAELQQLKVVAAQKSVELNDLYMMEMFQTIREWNRKYGPGRDKRWLRIGMPTSLRTPLHDHMPAANVVSYMFLTRRADECDRPDEMLAGIHRQTSMIVNERLGRFLAFALKYFQKIPGLLWCLLRLNRCFCSTVLTNVGDIRRHFKVRFPLKHGRCVAGNVILEALMGSPPVRPNTRLATSLGTYGGTLFINLHCDPKSFTREQADELADLFIDRLRKISPAVQAETKAA